MAHQAAPVAHHARDLGLALGREAFRVTGHLYELGATGQAEHFRVCARSLCHTVDAEPRNAVEPPAHRPEQ